MCMFISLFAFELANATPSTFSYQGRITDSSGGSPGFTMASFSFSIMVDTAGGNNPNCTLYREQKDLVPVSATGLFDVAIGEGTANFPNVSAKVHQYMNNSATVSCAEGGSFLVSSSDRRFLDVQFNPNGNTVWNHITPASEIRSVPYATNALTAESFGGLMPTDYIRKTDVSTCTTGQFLSYNGTMMTCSTPAGTGAIDASYSIKGLVQFLTDAATSGIVVTGGVARVNFGTGANQIVKLDGTGKLPALDGSALTGVVASSATTATTATTAGTATNFSGSLSGDVSGTQSTTSVNKVKGYPVVTTGVADGKVLKYSSGNLVFADDNSGSTVSDSSYTVKGIVQFQTDADTSGITVASGVARVNTGTAANQIVKIGADGKLPAIDGSNLTNLPTPGTVTNFSGSLVGDVTGTQGATVVEGIRGKTVDMTGVANGKVLKYDTAAGGKWVLADDNTGGTPGVASYSATGLVQFDTNAATSGVIVNGSGVAKVNFGTGADQIVKLDGTGKLPAVDGSALTNIVASSLSGILPIANGGTGASTAAGAFAALSPLAAKGDLISRTATAPAVLSVGTNGQVLTADSGEATGMKWASPTATDLTTIVGTGIVQRTGAGSYAALGTAAPLNVTGSDLGLSFGAGLKLDTGSLVVDSGTTAGKVVVVDGTGKLPAIDGSQLTNLPAPSTVANFSGSLVGDVTGTQGATVVEGIRGKSVDMTGVANGKVLKYDTSGGGKWILADDNTGGTPGVASYTGTGLVQFDSNATTSGIIVDGSGVAKVNFGNAADQIVKIGADGKLPAIDGSNLTNIVASSLSGTLPIANGGTGATAKLGAYNNLSPLSTAGDLVTHDGTNNVRMAKGTAGQILSSTAGGLQWINAPSGSITDVTANAPLSVTGTTTKDISISAATTSALGVVQVGSGLSVTAGGVVSVDASGLAVDPANFTAAVPVNKGGTGATTKTTGFNALSPLTTAGDIVTHDGTNSVRMARGTAGQILSSTAGGLAWISAPTSVADFTGSLVGDVSGTQGATSVDKIKGVPVVTTGIADGKILKYQSGNWVMADDATGSAPGDASYAAKGTVQFLTDAATSGISVTAGVASLNTGTAANNIVKIGADGKLPAIDGSNLTGIVASSINFTVPITSGGTGATTKTTGFNALSPLTTAGDIVTHDGTNSVRLAKGTTGQILSSTAGGLQWINAPTGSITDVTANAPLSVTGTTTKDISISAATAAALGVVQIGSGLSVTAGGVVSVNASGLAVDPANFSSAVPINKGGTGETSAAAGFAALSPLAAKGDIITRSSSAPMVLSVGTNGQVLVADSAETSGMRWGSNVATELNGLASTGIVQRTGAGTYTTLGVSSPLAISASNIVLNTVPIASGGTGQTTQTAAFNALSPLTTKGDMIVHNGTNNIRLPASTTNGQVLMVDTAEAGGVKWAAPAAAGVTTVSGTLPVVVANGSTTPTISVNDATAAAKGIVQVGSGLSVASGVVSVDWSANTGLTASRMVATNSSGGLSAYSCATGQYVTFNGSGEVICNNSPLLNGGNSYTAAATVGTNDGYALNLETNNTTRVVVGSAGNVTVNAPTSGEALVVTGSIRGKSYEVPSGTTVDWANGNTQSITTNCGSQLTFVNMIDGGVYTLAITASSTFSGSCTFGQTSPNTLTGGSGGSFYFLPTNATPSGTNAVYSFMRIGSKVYVNWSSGYAN
ncbi:beta strand repeat-containing protein [Bdellovibrio sp. HCB274]|uniref:beta strand repeat-containing protein n=1 Tax=Bdellovibrio sp. HCB274 TaxID=3394361 RepID=UPI0039B67489